MAEQLNVDRCPFGSYQLYPGSQSCTSCYFICPHPDGDWSDCATKCKEVYYEYIRNTTIDPVTNNTDTIISTVANSTLNSDNPARSMHSLVVGGTLLWHILHYIVPLLAVAVTTVVVSFALYKKVPRARRFLDDFREAFRSCGVGPAAVIVPQAPEEVKSVLPDPAVDPADEQLPLVKQVSNEPTSPSAQTQTQPVSVSEYSYPIQEHSEGSHRPTQLLIRQTGNSEVSAERPDSSESVLVDMASPIQSPATPGASYKFTTGARSFDNLLRPLQI